MPQVHQTHDTYISDSSVYDERCKNCGATDGCGDTGLYSRCPSPKALPVRPSETAKGLVEELLRSYHEFNQRQHPFDRPRVDEEYETARGKLLKYIANLENP